MISPLVGAGLSMAAPVAGRAALKLVDQATQTFASMLGAAADTLSNQTPDQAQAAPAASGTSVSIDSIRSLGKHLAADFHRRAIGALEAAGIDTSHEFSLRLGSQNEVIVMGDHPDKQLIEQLLNSDELPELFNRLTGLQEIAQAYDERPAFRESFGRDPLAAVAAYAQSSHDSFAGVVQLTLSGQGISVDFPTW
jgi:hypothetical protein